ncbi:hypothetical protein [Tateyamaria sp. ANG-S1]|uniref:hypothetical protein n=1 Tax=Tateyamaria sp. ANG-S1 TaxID=1577905 RepID=UPI00057D1CD6|nr:hypothetical protein [Tateyamaria sp. ANG-S1]KIC48848.1 hypothetical protein RA29_14335 [Tateyamaria sp. ANG-S1]
MHPEPDAATRLALLRMSKLLCSLKNDMSSVTDLVSELVLGQGAALEGAQLEQLQKLDRLDQSLRDLSIVSEILADGMNDVTQRQNQLSLSETRAILYGDPAASVPKPSGEVELF